MQQELLNPGGARHEACRLRIGVEFQSGGGVWRCTDVGTRIVTAIRMDRVEKASKQGDAIVKGALNRNQAEAEGAGAALCRGRNRIRRRRLGKLRAIPLIVLDGTTAMPYKMTCIASC